jgi:putative FmdB family regulatory protein
MLNPPHPEAYNSVTTLHNHAEFPMPHYEFFCDACKKTFSKVLTLAQYEKGKVICPHCGSKRVEQSWSAFTAITSKKSA